MHRAFALSNDGEFEDAALPIGRCAAPRLRLSLPARIVTISESRRCILIDLSRTGAQVGLEDPLREGTDIFLQIASLDQFGTVLRRARGLRGGLNGIEFEEPLSDEDVIAMRHYAESFQNETNRALRREVQAWVTGLD